MYEEIVTEECRSGWSGRSWKPLNPQGFRGFESHLFLHLKKKLRLQFLFCIVSLYCFTSFDILYGWSDIRQIGHNETAIIGSNLDYAAIHQLGGQAGKNKKVSIPARPYLYLSDDNFKEILQETEKYLKD